MSAEQISPASASKAEPIDDATNNSDSDEGPEFHLEKWFDVVQSLRTTTSDAFAASPAFDASSPSSFQTYWRHVFIRLRNVVSADDKIPHFLTEPPVEKFTITLFDTLDALGCPCCHPSVEPNIVLENKGGVTKVDLLQGVIDTLYGEALPRVYMEPCPPAEEREGYEGEMESESDDEDDDDFGDEEDAEYQDKAGVVVYMSSWMSSGGGTDGETRCYGDEPNIFLYCCSPNVYVKKMEREEKKEEQALARRMEREEEKKAQTLARKSSKL
ncbi:hypothetical protein G7046_g6187 [Stylonectria norvegica]|nr:hypothetical protein G7046_g6187 [Stylonectria norvegica]